MNIEMANRLYNYRKQSGLSQEELADKLGLSRQAVSKWERAEACPDTDNLIRLSKLYGVSIDTLLHIDPDEIITDTDTDSEETSGDKTSGTENVPEDKEKETEKDAGNDETTIGFMSGIHIVDGKDTVNIDKSGIHVTDGDEVVHIGWKGIHVKKAGENEVHVSFDGERSSKNDDCGDCGSCGGCGGYSQDGGKSNAADKDVRVHFNIRDRKKKYIKDIPVGLFITITYLIIGFTWNLWHPGWILFICIPIIDSIINAVTYGSIRKFNYPVFIVAAYLFVGCVYGHWHPAWVSFLTIPLFYWIF